MKIKMAISMFVVMSSVQALADKKLSLLNMQIGQVGASYVCAPNMNDADLEDLKIINQIERKTTLVAGQIVKSGNLVIRCGIKPELKMSVDMYCEKEGKILNKIEKFGPFNVTKDQLDKNNARSLSKEVEKSMESECTSRGLKVRGSSVVRVGILNTADVREVIEILDNK